jgi:hypothetical protein
MPGLVRLLEGYVGPPTITVGVLRFVVFLRCMLEFYTEFGCLPFVEHDIPSVVWEL